MSLSSRSHSSSGSRLALPPFLFPGFFPHTRAALLAPCSLRCSRPATSGPSSPSRRSASRSACTTCTTSARQGTCYSRARCSERPALNVRFAYPLHKRPAQNAQFATPLVRTAPPAVHTCAWQLIMVFPSFTSGENDILRFSYTRLFVVYFVLVFLTETLLVWISHNALDGFTVSKALSRTWRKIVGGAGTGVRARAKRAPHTIRTKERPCASEWSAREPRLLHHSFSARSRSFSATRSNGGYGRSSLVNSIF